MRTRLHPADATLVAVIGCFAVGLFAVWAAHGFTWSSPHRVVSAPEHKPRARRQRVVVTPRHHIRHRRTTPHLTLVATRGASWVSVRAGSATGRMLYEGLLSPRERITLPGKRFVA